MSRLTCVVRGAGVVAFALLLIVAAGSAAMAQAAKAGIEDTWQGTLHVTDPGGKDLRTVLKISKDEKGALTGQMFSIDQGGQGIKTSSISFQDGVLKYGIERIDLTYEGKISSDGRSITGAATQGGTPRPLIFERTTPATAWAIPEPPPPTPRMAADANPTFEVATVKPSKPDAQGWGIQVIPGGRFRTLNTTLLDLIKFSYDLQDKQVVEAPAWVATDKFDVSAQPDIPGLPNERQLKNMVQKLLTDRFQLKFHDDKRELSAYVLRVSKDGPKIKKSESQDGLPGYGFRGLGILSVNNSDMDGFCRMMQASVLDRPVVNQTALEGRWSFLLKWTPDESQFGGKMKMPEPAADAPPPLFTAMPEQLGLKLDAEKAQVKTMVIDHVDKPSDN
ncbi:TIGR03435 family protein [Granulicella paludicola]|uniref:TIGR03435 family protein n=1 Tax=Granulicella paludicola TaxID=474951 RepID=UPI0021E05E46|nr:TIGR03435 family protein [Granulicella paludicola]